MADDTFAEGIVALLGAAVFVAALVVVGNTYGNGGLSQEGGYAMIGAIGLFILLMAVAGYWLSTRSA